MAGQDEEVTWGTSPLLHPRGRARAACQEHTPPARGTGTRALVSVPLAAGVDAEEAIRGQVPDFDDRGSQRRQGKGLTRRLG